MAAIARGVRRGMQGDTARIPATAPAIATGASTTAAPVIPSPHPDAMPAPADGTAIPADAKDSSMDTIDDARDTATSTAETAADRLGHGAQAMFGDVSGRARDAVEKSRHLLGELADFNKGTLEALAESSRIAARGFETMGQDAAAYARTSFEGTTQAMRTLAAVKSPSEFMQLQADYARTAFDAMVAQTSRSTEASLKLAGEVAQPISNRVALAAERIRAAG